jgi:DNA repair protein RadA/Sms
MRAERIGNSNENCYVLNEVSLQNIFTRLQQLKPDVLIIDSVQTLQDEELESSPGSISQIRNAPESL